MQIIGCPDKEENNANINVPLSICIHPSNPFMRGKQTLHRHDEEGNQEAKQSS